jgi:glutamine cyclotransferase
MSLRATNLIGFGASGGGGIVGWDISTAVYSGTSFSVVAQDTGSVGLAFRSDGTSFYMMGFSNDAVYQYDLATAWDISTAAYSGNSFNVAAQNTGPVGLAFRSDGSGFYVSAAIGTPTIYQYDLGTAWDLSTASYSGASVSVAATAANPRVSNFKNSGDVVFVADRLGGVIYQYDLGTAWDISTASYSGNSFNVAAQDMSPTAIHVRSDGLRFVISGTDSDTIYQYDLGTAWDLSTASYSGTSVSVAAQDVSPTGLVVIPDGSKLLHLGFANDNLYEYDL